MYRKSALLIVVHFFLVCCASSNDFVMYKKGVIIPKVFSADKNSMAVKDFLHLFEKATGQKLEIISKRDTLAPTIELSIQKNHGFYIEIKDEALKIIGGSEYELRKGIRYFFSNYTSFNQFSIQKASFVPLQEIVLPAKESATEKGFAYREPYFSQNFDPVFRLWNNTHTLEEVWGLWGHNIGKFIKVTPQMLAIVNGKINDEQLNFSSPELQKALEQAIKEKWENEPTIKKFMIMPYDNEIVCQCKQCIALGNTQTNASPSVFNLIDKLASKFPELEFFTTAYISTETPPKTAVKPNVGVMLSTMPFPKGVVIETSNKAEKIEKTIVAWKNITPNIYLWDYAINFDNYFDAYPTVSIAQKNLKYYKSKGITGVFMQGSESFCAFGNLKSYLYAQLLNNPDIDLKKHIKLFFANNYPKMGESLANYYLQIENSAFENKKTINIYGGIQQSKNKYLKLEYINNLINKIYDKQNALSKEERLTINQLLLELTFQKLEILRTTNLGPESYATFKPENSSAVLSKEVPKLIELVKTLSKKLGIDVYNESGFTLANYISQWEETLVSKPYKNFFYKKPLDVLSKLDEDYSNSSILNDGLLGFDDYYNNWLICSIGNLIIETGTANVDKAKTLVIRFLSNRKHKIYLPEKVTVSIGDQKFEAPVAQNDETNTRRIIEVTVPISVPKLSQKIKIEIKKFPGLQNKAIACDEIIFK